MTIRQFNASDEMEQAEAMWSGTHLGNRYDEVYIILLYQIDSFYVEAFYHREHNVLHRFESFEDVDQLEPYLGQFDIILKVNPKKL